MYLEVLSSIHGKPDLGKNWTRAEHHARRCPSAIGLLAAQLEFARATPPLVVVPASAAGLDRRVFALGARAERRGVLRQRGVAPHRAGARMEPPPRCAAAAAQNAERDARSARTEAGSGRGLARRRRERRRDGGEGGESAPMGGGHRRNRRRRQEGCQGGLARIRQRRRRERQRRRRARGQRLGLRRLRRERQRQEPDGQLPGGRPGRKPPRPPRTPHRPPHPPRAPAPGGGGSGSGRERRRR